MAAGFLMKVFYRPPPVNYFFTAASSRTPFSKQPTSASGSVAHRKTIHRQSPPEIKVWEGSHPGASRPHDCVCSDSIKAIS
jgi:hypothetical protein